MRAERGLCIDAAKRRRHMLGAAMTRRHTFFRFICQASPSKSSRPRLHFQNASFPQKLFDSTLNIAIYRATQPHVMLATYHFNTVSLIIHFRVSITFETGNKAPVELDNVFLSASHFYFNAYFGYLFSALGLPNVAH